MGILPWVCYKVNSHYVCSWQLFYFQRSAVSNRWRVAFEMSPQLLSGIHFHLSSLISSPSSLSFCANISRAFIRKTPVSVLETSIIQRLGKNELLRLSVTEYLKNREIPYSNASWMDITSTAAGKHLCQIFHFSRHIFRE